MRAAPGARSTPRRAAWRWWRTRPSPGSWCRCSRNSRCRCRCRPGVGPVAHRAAPVHSTTPPPRRRSGRHGPQDRLPAVLPMVWAEAPNPWRRRVGPHDRRGSRPPRHRVRRRAQRRRGRCWPPPPMTRTFPPGRDCSGGTTARHARRRGCHSPPPPVAGLPVGHFDEVEVGERDPQGIGHHAAEGSAGRAEPERGERLAGLCAVIVEHFAVNPRPHS